MQPLAPPSTGLGLRRALLDELQSAPAGDFDFLECAPENWIGVGGKFGDALETLAAKHPLACHGLSLSLGGFAPLDETFLGRVRRFLERHDVALYSEHLSYCADDGQLYDLLPIPFTEEAVHFVAARIRQAQDILGRRIAVENVSYYAAPGADPAKACATRIIEGTLDARLVAARAPQAVRCADPFHVIKWATEALDQVRRDMVNRLRAGGHHDEATALKHSRWALLKIRRT